EGGPRFEGKGARRALQFFAAETWGGESVDGNEPFKRRMPCALCQGSVCLEFPLGHLVKPPSQGERQRFCPCVAGRPSAIPGEGEGRTSGRARACRGRSEVARGSSADGERGEGHDQGR